ncbi:MAG: preprotein translocase subunit YajC [Aristaeellaceae bacterium]
MELLYKLLGVTAAIAENTSDLGEQANAGGLGYQIVSLLFTFFPFIILIVIMYFMMIRPEKKRKKKEAEMLAALKCGDRICTIGGIYGTITGIKEDTITLTVGRENMTMVVARWAIRSVEDVTIENESKALN